MKQGTVVSIGTFDGVHLGHQAILREVRNQAKSLSLLSLAYAFSVPPRWAMSGIDERILLLPTSTKLRVLQDFVDIPHPAQFAAVRSMDPEQFIEDILIGDLNARVIVEGETFRFARNRSGDLDTLISIGQKHGLDIISVPPVMVGNVAVSSTRIREAIQDGDIQAARSYLGRPPMLCGTVAPGDQLGGELGYPTANLNIDPHVLLPLDGLYLVHVFASSILTNGLLYVGPRPTLEDDEMRCEVHLLESPARSLQGEWLEVHLLERIRDDCSFASLSALRTQIEADVAKARRRIAAYPVREQRISS